MMLARGDDGVCEHHLEYACVLSNGVGVADLMTAAGAAFAVPGGQVIARNHRGSRRANTAVPPASSPIGSFTEAVILDQIERPVHRLVATPIAGTGQQRRGGDGRALLGQRQQGLTAGDCGAHAGQISTADVHLDCWG